MKASALVPAGLYAVADINFIGKERTIQAIEGAIKGGIKIVQLRWKERKKDREFLEIAKKTLLICKKNGIPLIINDRFDIALCAKAQGVHLGSGDIPPEEVKKISKKLIIGYSAHSIEEIELMSRSESVDYLAFGSIFTTSTKKEGDVIVQGLEKLRKAVKKTSLPLYAIGGINQKNIKEVVSTGVYGVASISAIFSPPDPCLNTKKLLKILDESKG